VSVPLFDLSRLGPQVDDAVREATLRVLGHRGYILGSEVEAFESDLVKYLNCLHTPRKNLAAMLRLIVITMQSVDFAKKISAFVRSAKHQYSSCVKSAIN
jgi:hypothetical protein